MIRIPPAISPTNTLRADVLKGLAANPKKLPSKYLYDEVGSALFEEICELPEYYVTRVELGIMAQHVDEIARLVGPYCVVIEYGSGSSRKTRMLLDRCENLIAYVPIDVACRQLEEASAAIADDYPDLAVLPVCADFTNPPELPLENLEAHRRVVYFPGSTIGNFDRAEALSILRRAQQLCGPGGALILGADLKKDPSVFQSAYNDAQGVTAAFNLNYLVRLNRDLGADFEPTDFWHHAFYNPQAGRIEMHLVSKRAQHVNVAGRRFSLCEGESICTEYSHKYSIAELRDLLSSAGFETRRFWTDERRCFSVVYAHCRG